jgi:predicted phosphodiesterase
MDYDVEKLVKPNDYNILIHAGDCTNVGRKYEVEDFIYWFKNIKGFNNKFFIAGNHDTSFEYFNNHKNLNDSDKISWIYQFLDEEELFESDCVYLEDQGFVINVPNFYKPIKLYGSPWQPEFYSWAFNLPRNGSELELKWKNIPDDTDILITHGPPHGILDFNPSNQPCGCELLSLRVKEIKPLLHIFGHIHHGYGVRYINDSLFVNASICTEKYDPINKPIVIDIKEIDGQILSNIYNYE